MKRKSNIPVLKYVDGLTLIEVVISMAVFAIGFMAIAGLVIATSKNNTTGNMLTEATMLAQSRIEYLKMLPLDQLAAACPEGAPPEHIKGVYARACQISPLGSSTTINTVKVTVSWKKTRKSRQVVLQTNTRGRGK